jgi:hypothetical protein
MDDFSDLFKVTIKSLEKLEKAEPMKISSQN